jgi:hypothetical protein
VLASAVRQSGFQLVGPARSEPVLIALAEKLSY